MKTLASIRASLVIGLLGLGFGLRLQAQTLIFDNSENDLLTRFNPGTVEVGDEIILAGTDRYLTQFSFEYWGVNTDHPLTFQGDVEARVTFYLNDGNPPFNGYPTPGTVLYQSAFFPVTPTDRSTLVFTAGSDGIPDGGLFLPSSDITWSVQFEGMEGSDSVGVDIYSPPVVGSDYPDYWANDGGWALLTNTVPMDFAAQMYANATIPEPSSLVLSLLGGVGLLTFVRRLRTPA